MRSVKIARDSLCPRNRAVDHTDLGDTCIAQCRHNGSCRTAGPEDYRGTRTRIPIRHGVAQILDKTECVRISGFERPIRRDDYRVYSADPARHGIHLVHDGEGRLFMWYRQIAAAKAEDWQRTERSLNVIRPNRQGHIDPVDSCFFEPKTMQQG